MKTSFVSPNLAPPHQPLPVFSSSLAPVRIMLIFVLIIATTMLYLAHLARKVLATYATHKHIPMPVEDGWLVGHLITITKHRFNQT